MNIIPLIAMLVLSCMRLCAQQPSHKAAAAPFRINAGITQIHIADPVHEGMPGKGSFEIFHEGKVLFAGSSRKNKLHGKWTSWYTNGVVCDSGKLTNGMPDGEWRFYNEDGSLRYLRNYSEGKYIRITNEMLHANPKMVLYPLTRLYKRNAAKALQCLKSEYTFGQYHPAVFTSLAEHVISNISSSHYQPVFSKSLHHGLYVNMGEDGLALDSGTYVNGLRNGHWLHRGVNGERQEGFYKDGVRRKDWKLYNRSGTLIRLESYDADGHVTWSKYYN